MTHHHAKKSSSHNHEHEAGFLSLPFKKLMTRRDKVIILLISFGIIALVLLSIVFIFRKNMEENDMANIPTSTNIVLTPYPTIPKEIKDTTVMINRRSIEPKTTTIKVGGSVGFFNEDQITVTIEGVGSDILNIGPIAPLEVPVVVFPSVGTFKYQNPQNPTDIAEIIVEN